MTITGKIIDSYIEAQQAGLSAYNAFDCAIEDNRELIERIETFVEDCSHGPTAQMSLKAYEQDIRAEATQLLRMFE